MRPARLALVTAFASLITCSHALATVLATQQLPTPLAPDMPSNLSIPMPPSIDPKAPIWVAYRTLALSADASPSGEIVVDGSFEGVATPINASIVVFTPDAMSISSSAGTIQQQFEALYGQRSSEQMKSLLGAELHAAYEAANAGSGRILDGTLVKTLPALGANQGTLLVSVERATGIQPVGVFVTVGQGELPADIAARGSAQASPAFGIGRIFGVLAFLGLLYWFFVARRRS
ncbi:MAG: hypothetical protein H4O13_09255 [Xanthomonadales bacterium]|nr:hypothetical protein [Xanthomonadales bacterium]